MSHAEPSGSFRDQVIRPGRDAVVLREALRLDVPRRGDSRLHLRGHRSRGRHTRRHQPAAGRRAAGHVFRGSAGRRGYPGGRGGAGRKDHPAGHVGAGGHLRVAGRSAGAGGRIGLGRQLRQTADGPRRAGPLGRLGMAASTDNALLARAVAGDDAAFAELVEPYRGPVFRHCYRMLGSGADAEDATQDTLERAWRRLATYDGSGPFGAWLQRIAINVCLDGLRARRTRIGPVGYGPPAAPGAMPGPPDPELAWVEPVSDSDLRVSQDPQDEVVRREDISLALVAALHVLAPRQRASLLLHGELGFTHRG